jgi:2,3-dihydroxyphenylpropionate 1,2-dioxygenase
MAQIVAAALVSHGPLVTGRPEVSKPEQRERVYAGFEELCRRLADARPDLIGAFVNDHLQNFPYSIFSRRSAWPSTRSQHRQGRATG